MSADIKKDVHVSENLFNAQQFVQRVTQLGELEIALQEIEGKCGYTVSDTDFLLTLDPQNTSFRSIQEREQKACRKFRELQLTYDNAAYGLLEYLANGKPIVEITYKRVACGSGLVNKDETVRERVYRASITSPYFTTAKDDEVRLRELIKLCYLISKREIHQLIRDGNVIASLGYKPPWVQNSLTEVPWGVLSFGDKIILEKGTGVAHLSPCLFNESEGWSPSIHHYNEEKLKPLNKTQIDIILATFAYLKQHSPLNVQFTYHPFQNSEKGKA